MELVEAFGWGSPIGIGVFIISIATALFLFAATIAKLSQIDREQNPDKYSK